MLTANLQNKFYTKPTRLEKTKKTKNRRRLRVLNAKFVLDLGNQFQFDDQVFRYRIKERFWSQLMSAKQNSLGFFLLACKTSFKQITRGKSESITYMLNYFDFI